MKIKTSELSGVALDWAVAQAVGIEVKLIRHSTGYCAYIDYLGEVLFDPSEDWAIGGPLIAKYLMDFCVDHPHTIGAALCDENGMYMNMLFGETHLIAACRAIVAAKLGDEVDVPEGLV